MENGRSRDWRLATGATFLSMLLVPPGANA